MAYEATATRRRPQTFDQLAGQEFVSSTLKNAVLSGKIAHAYLFSGPRGCGKTSTARILAKALNCEKGPTDQPCGACPSCVETARGASLDVIEIDGASNTSVENVRQIRDEVLFPPNSSRYKVYIIDEVHMLSNSAFNALLKTIEEPPPYIVFIFATTELHKVPATIKSRCQQFNFRLGTVDAVKDLLAQAARENGIEIEEEALFWIAKESTGSFRDAYTLFDQVASFSGGKVTIGKIKEKLGFAGVDELNGFMETCAAGSAGAAIEILDTLLSRGITVEQLCVNLAEYMRAALLLKRGVAKDSILGYPAARYSRKAIDALGPEQIERGLSVCLDLYRQTRYSVNPRFELELAAAKLSALAGYISPRELRAEVEAMKSLLSGGAAEGGSASQGGAGSQGNAGRSQSPEEAPKRPPEPAAAGGDQAEETESTNASVSGAESLAAGGDLAALKQAVVASLRKTRGMLAASLDKSQPWSVAGESLVIPFARGWEADIVRQETRSISEKIRALSGKEYSLDVRAEAPEKAPEAREAEAGDPADEGTEDPVTVVERLFRGTVVGEREIGEAT